MKNKTEISSMEKIFNAAVSEFSTEGYNGARIDRIAEKAGINKAMIYYHFNSKELLYIHVLSAVVDGIYTKIRDLMSRDDPPGQNLENLVRGYVYFLTEYPEEYLRIMLREVASGGAYFRKITVPRLIKPVLEMYTEMIVRGQKEGVFADLNPVFTMMHVIGSVVFFNLMRITLTGEPVFDEIFKEGYASAYGENLIKLLKSGIYRSGDNEI